MPVVTVLRDKFVAVQGHSSNENKIIFVSFYMYI